MMGPVIRLEPTLDGWGFEEGATMVKMDDGTFKLSVAEEQAVDSYNQSFECGVTLTVEQVEQLRDWLIEMTAT